MWRRSREQVQHRGAAAEAPSCASGCRLQDVPCLPSDHSKSHSQSTEAVAEVYVVVEHGQDRFEGPLDLALHVCGTQGQQAANLAMVHAVAAPACVLRQGYLQYITTARTSCLAWCTASPSGWVASLARGVSKAGEAVVMGEAGSSGSTTVDVGDLITAATDAVSCVALLAARRGELGLAEPGGDAGGLRAGAGEVEGGAGEGWGEGATEGGRARAAGEGRGEKEFAVGEGTGEGGADERVVAAAARLAAPAAAAGVAVACEAAAAATAATTSARSSAWRARMAGGARGRRIRAGFGGGALSAERLCGCGCANTGRWEICGGTHLGRHSQPAAAAAARMGRALEAPPGQLVSHGCSIRKAASSKAVCRVLRWHALQLKKQHTAQGSRMSTL